MDNENEMLFVGIRDPTDLRKNLLESSKGIIECLRRHEKLKHIHDEKEKMVHKLRLTLKEIEDQITKFKSNMPKTGLKPITEQDDKTKHEISRVEVEIKKPEPIVEKTQKVKKIKGKVKPKPIQKQSVDALTKLEDELKDIESKLSSL